VIVPAQALALAEVTGATLVQAGTEMNPAQPQDGEHHEGTEVPIEDGHVSGLQTI
jgi:hypothetical protein